MYSRIRAYARQSVEYVAFGFVFGLGLWLAERLVYTF